MIDIDRALELLTGNPDSITEQDDIDFEKAQKLALEALKVFRAVRPYSNTNKSYYLPGETPPPGSKESKQ